MDQFTGGMVCCTFQTPTWFLKLEEGVHAQLL